MVQKYLTLRCLLQTFCMQVSSNLLCKLRTAWTICCLCRLVVACTAGKLQQHVRALMEFGRYICCIRLTTLQARCSKTKTQLCSLLQFLTTDKRWYLPVTEWKGLLLAEHLWLTLLRVSVSKIRLIIARTRNVLYDSEQSFPC